MDYAFVMLWRWMRTIAGASHVYDSVKYLMSSGRWTTQGANLTQPVARVPHPNT